MASQAGVGILSTTYTMKDMVKKTRRRLDERGVDHRFHDYRKDGLDGAQLQGWIDALGWEKLLNRGGTTFRTLPDAEKDGLDADKARALMLEAPAMIRRPLVEADGKLSVGFSADDWQQRFA